MKETYYLRVEVNRKPNITVQKMKRILRINLDQDLTIEGEEHNLVISKLSVWMLDKRKGRLK